MAERLYPLRHSKTYFRVGVAADGQQAVLGIQHPDIVALYFAASGWLESVEARTFDYELMDDRYELELDCWHRELGAAAGTAWMKRFFLPQRSIGIADLPEHYRDFLDHVDDYEPARQSELQADINEWQLDKMYVFHWNEEYHVDASGEIVAT